MASKAVQNEKLVMNRLLRIIETTAPGSNKESIAYHRIGQVLQAQTVSYITRLPRPQKSGKANLIDTGYLRNSINYKIYSDRVEVGSYGVPYAAFHEFGFHGVKQVMQHMRLQTTAFGKVLKEPKNVQVSAHQKKINYAGNPYLRPAFIRQYKKINEIVQSIFGVEQTK